MSSSNWWASKLGNGGKPSSTPPSSAPPRVPVQVSPQQSHGMPVEYDPESDSLTTSARSARETDRCPECLSGNYFSMTGTSYRRCYDCGYPIVQSGSGPTMPGGSSSGPSQPARQIEGGGYNPSQVVGRIE